MFFSNLFNNIENNIAIELNLTQKIYIILKINVDTKIRRNYIIIYRLFLAHEVPLKY